VSVPLTTLNKLTDFNETWYEHHATRGHLTIGLPNFTTSIILTQQPFERQSQIKYMGSALDEVHRHKKLQQIFYSYMNFLIKEVTETSSV
jgi:hypothetical protein